MSWIGVDWGTSSLRGARFDDRGDVLEERAFARGILTVPSGQFGAVFAELFGDWMEPADARCLISGMAGSQQGWREAPYCACPASVSDVAARLTWIEPGRIAIVPGMRCEHDGVPDVMRGEETQIFGALQLLGIDSGVFLLPGTHSKWVDVEARRIERFTTLMTGEFYALLRKHSILARTLPADDDGALVESAFDAGLARALRSASLMQSAFSVRTLSLFDRMPIGDRASYLSGLVIGEELRSRGFDDRGASRGASVVVIGADALTRRYERALEACNVNARSVGSAAGWSGLWSLTRSLHA